MSPISIEQTLQTALAHHQAGRFADAETLYRQVLAVKPRDFGALQLLGALAMQVGKPEFAAELLTRAVAINPATAEIYSNLGAALRAIGRTDGAISAHRRAIDLKPELASSHYNLGCALQSLGQSGEAIAAYRRAVALDPSYAEAHHNIGAILQADGRFDEAIAAFGAALRCDPGNADAQHNLGNAHRKSGRLDEALVSLREALRIDPGHAEAHDSLLLTICYHPEYDAQSILAESLRWARAHIETQKSNLLPHRNDPSPERRLRLGYVSQDFRRHVSRQNILSLLREHSRDQFEVFCYAYVRKPDRATEEFRQLSDHWRDLVGLSDDDAARMIRHDGIDLLIDLGSHTAENRLLIFARKPAPVQVTYLAYCGTTGLETIDYRLSDPYLDPPETGLDGYSERTVRLAGSYWVYEPFGPTPEVSPPPAAAAGCVTFGCLNDFAKVSLPALGLWMKILGAVPRSRLLLQTPPGSSRTAIVERAAESGLAAERLEFVGFQPWSQYLECLQRIDIALDPFPYGGGITTCDALWMGVPVVTLSGRTAVGRAGRSILSNIGLPELIAETPEQYVEIAVSLANDLPRLAELRAGLRQRMESSPLRDTQAHVRDIENAYRQMWQTWCKRAAQLKVESCRRP